MASLALGLGAAAVGFTLGGPLGASLGWGIGAAVGARLFAKNQEGPRLTDNTVQTASYGEPIPIGFGTQRIAGKIMWSKPRTEHAHKSGGKGTPSVKEFSYTQSYAVLLCETTFLQDGVLVNNPIVDILRIWKDGDLVYGEGSDGAALQMTIYYGTEDQLPDPTMEAAEGVGYVSAHRGTAYVVFNETSMILPNNLTFEVVFTGAVELQFYSQWPVDYQFPIDASGYSFPYLLNGVERSASGVTLHRYRSGADYGASMGTSDNNVVYYDQSAYDLYGVLLSTEPQTTFSVSAGNSVAVYGSMNSGIAYARWQESIDCSAYGKGASTFVNRFAWLLNGAPTYVVPSDLLCNLATEDFAHTWTASHELQITGTMVYWNGNIYATGGSSTTMWIHRWPAPDGAVYIDVPDAEFNLRDYSHDDAASGPGDLIIGTDGYLYCRVSYSAGASPDPEVFGGWGVKLIKLDADLNFIQDWYDPAPGPGGPISTALGIPGRSSAVIFRGYYISYQSAGVLDIAHGNFVLYRMNADESFTFVDEIAPVQTGANVPSALIYIGGGLAAFRGGIIQLGSDGTTWGAIVANVSQHVGYADTEYDVSELVDPVRGYVIGNRMSGRAAIEAGMPAYQHGAVESNLEVKFPKWGGNVLETVTADDLGARDDSSDPVDPLTIIRRQDKDLPQRIEVIYLNKNMEYQEGMQYSQRTASFSDFNAAVNIPITLVDSEAKRMSDVLLYNAHIERDQFKFSLPRKFAHWEPTDVHDVDGHAVRITNKDEQGYTHINFEGVATRTNVFINGPVAVPPLGFVPPGTVPPVTTVNKTDLLLLDLPLVTDDDFANGFYAAIAGRMEGTWPGAGVFKSIDGGVNYTSIYSTVVPDIFGVATTVLGSFGGGNIFDESNTVTVRLTPGSGELSSSNQLGVLNGANTAMLGTEMIQFKTAVLVADKTYTLSGLLRGRRGTEWAMTGHAINDNFVFLPCHNMEGAFAEIAQARLYKAVTPGGSLSSSTEISFTNTGVALKTYAPTSLGGGRNAAGDIILNWTRRDRKSAPFLVTPPLSEASEQYVVTVYSSSSYATLIFSWLVNGATTTTFVAADQTTYYGSPQATLYWAVAQIGVLGSGYRARGLT